MIGKKISSYFKQLSFGTASRIALFNIIRRVLNPDVNNSYSEAGEDIIVETLLGTKPGFYIEVGSNHPINRSNTFKLYYNGWKGVCIDPNGGLCKLHKKIRPNDIVLNYAVSDKEGLVDFYKFDFNLVSTIEKSNLSQWEESYGNYTTVNAIQAKRLDSILEEIGLEKLNNNQIDLLSCDVEGHDLNVIRSLDLNKHRPRVIIIEMHGFSLTNCMSNEIYTYLTSNGYQLIYFANINGYFADQQ